MPKFSVRASERVYYEPVIVEAENEEMARDIARDFQPSDLDESAEDGDDWSADVQEADADDLANLREIQLDEDGEVIPFKS